MLEHGERQATTSDLMKITRAIFPEEHPWDGDAEFELDQYRKLLAFLREVRNSPSLETQLKWALTSRVRHGYSKVPREFNNFLKTYNGQNRFLREMAARAHPAPRQQTHDAREPAFA